MFFSSTAWTQERPMSVQDYEMNIKSDCKAEVASPVFESTCKGEIQVTTSDRSYSGGCLGNIERTYAAIDACGNSMSVQRYILLTDNEAPVFTEQFEDIRVKDMTVLRMGHPNAVDNCEGELLWSADDTPIEGGTERGISRVFTVTDLCGNSASSTVYIYFEN